MASQSNELISPVTTKSPEFIITTAAINDEPIELDSTPMSPDKSKVTLPESMTSEEQQVCTSHAGPSRLQRSLQLGFSGENA